MVFPSKVDRWLLVVLAIALGFTATAGLRGLGVGGPAGSLAALGLLVIGCGLPLWMFFSTRYVIDAETLTVRCGPFRWQIPLADITAVEPTRNPLSSPALSLDRLAIRYADDRRLMVSPADKRGFLDALGQP